MYTKSVWTCFGPCNLPRSSKNLCMECGKQPAENMNSNSSSDHRRNFRITCGESVMRINMGGSRSDYFSSQSIWRWSRYFPSRPIRRPWQRFYSCARQSIALDWFANDCKQAQLAIEKLNGYVHTVSLRSNILKFSRKNGSGMQAIKFNRCLPWILVTPSNGMHTICEVSNNRCCQKPHLHLLFLLIIPATWRCAALTFPWHIGTLCASAVGQWLLQ